MADNSNEIGWNLASFFWSVADLLRGDYQQSEYGNVVLPLTLLRRLDCVLEPTKDEVLERYGQMSGKVANLSPILTAVSGEPFYNTSKLTLTKVIDDPAHIAENLREYVHGFSGGARDVFDKFEFDVQITRLQRANLLQRVLSRFCDIDLHPDKVSNIEMGYLYEELIRRFSELKNETAGEHFTPREVIRLMVNLLLVVDNELLHQRGIVRTLFDPACGTGGMLSVAEEHLRDLNPTAQFKVYGQEANAQTYAICRSNVTLRGQDVESIILGNTLSADGFPNRRFDYMLANPPFGLQWKKAEAAVRDEHESKGFNGRFGAGLPRINDGSLLFLQHMISKMRAPHEGGSRLAIIFNGSPMFMGPADSGEAKIRRWIIESDMLDAVVALPNELFYNTGIPTYIWVLTNRKPSERQGKVRLVDARDLWTKMRKSVGDKSKQLTDDQIRQITRLYGHSDEGRRVKILPNEAFATQDDGRDTLPSNFAIAPRMFLDGVGPTTHLRLDALATLNPERRSPIGTDRFIAVPDLRTVPRRAGDLGYPPSDDRVYHVCRSGDVVGRGRVWAALPSEFGEALTSLDVVRLYPARADVSNLLCMWLGSDDAARQLAGTLTPHLRPDLMVPRYLITQEELLDAATRLQAARDNAVSFVESLFGDPFPGSAQDDDPGAHLLELAQRAETITHILQPVGDVLQRAELGLPYPIADLARRYRLQRTSERQLDIGLRLVEALIRCLGTLSAAAWLSSVPSDAAEILQSFSGGISTGSWLDIVQKAQSRNVMSDIPELAHLSFKRRGLGERLREAVSIRNRAAHAHGPLSPVRAADMRKRLDPIVIDALDAVMWLGAIEFLHIMNCTYRAAGLGFEVEANNLIGAHPVWETRVFRIPDPLPADRVVARLSASPRTLDLHPFFTVDLCTICEDHEMYTLDHVYGKRATSLSVRDHLREFDL